MMKKKAFIILLIIMTVFLAACKKKATDDKNNDLDSDDINKVTVTITPTVTVADPATPTPTPEPDLSHEGEMRSYLSGLWVPVEVGTKRPYAIQFNNFKTVKNQWGIGQAPK